MPCGSSPNNPQHVGPMPDGSNQDNLAALAARAGMSPEAFAAFQGALTAHGTNPALHDVNAGRPSGVPGSGTTVAEPPAALNVPRGACPPAVRIPPQPLPCITQKQSTIYVDCHEQSVELKYLADLELSQWGVVNGTFGVADKVPCICPKPAPSPTPLLACPTPEDAYNRIKRFKLIFELGDKAPMSALDQLKKKIENLERSEITREFSIALIEGFTGIIQPGTFLGRLAKEGVVAALKVAVGENWKVAGFEAITSLAVATFTERYLEDLPEGFLKALDEKLLEAGEKFGDELGKLIDEALKDKNKTDVRADEEEGVVVITRKLEKPPKGTPEEWCCYESIFVWRIKLEGATPPERTCLVGIPFCLDEKGENVLRFGPIPDPPSCPEPIKPRDIGEMPQWEVAELARKGLDIVRREQGIQTDKLLKSKGLPENYREIKTKLDEAEKFLSLSHEQYVGKGGTEFTQKNWYQQGARALEKARELIRKQK
jgi:hypothetical protein